MPGHIMAGFDDLPVPDHSGNWPSPVYRVCRALSLLRERRGLGPSGGYATGSAGAPDPDGDDVQPVILLVIHGIGVVAQQAQG